MLGDACRRYGLRTNLLMALALLVCPALGIKPAIAKPPKRVEIKIHDANPELLKRVKAVLKSRGFIVVQMSETEFVHEGIKIFYRKGFRTQASQLAKALPYVKTVQPITWRSLSPLMIVIGMTDDASSSPTPSDSVDSGADEKSTSGKGTSAAQGKKPTAKDADDSDLFEDLEDDELLLEQSCNDNNDCLADEVCKNGECVAK